MSRRAKATTRKRSLVACCGVVVTLIVSFIIAEFVVTPIAGVLASTVSPTSSAWCGAFGGSFAVWADTSPNMPICGPGPDYGGTWSIVDLPVPGGFLAGYLNGTPGFQCVELAERYLDVKFGFGPISAEGSTVAMNYHASCTPCSSLVVNRTKGAIGHAPVAGDVISFSDTPYFDDGGDGHVAVVVAAKVNRKTGDGAVLVAQENVAQGDYHYRLDLVDWQLRDPAEPADAEFQFPYAEWLHVDPHAVLRGPSILIKKAPRHKKKTTAVFSL